MKKTAQLLTYERQAMHETVDVTRQQRLFTTLRILHEYGEIREIEHIEMFGDAAKEIAEAQRIDFSHMGYAVGDLNKTSNGSSEAEDDYTKQQERLLEKLSNWRKEATRLEVSVCYDLGVFNLTIEDSAFSKLKAPQEIAKIYHAGLKKWQDVNFKVA